MGFLLSLNIFHILNANKKMLMIFESNFDKYWYSNLINVISREYFCVSVIPEFFPSSGISYFSLTCFGFCNKVVMMGPITGSTKHQAETKVISTWCESNKSSNRILQ